MNIFLIGYLISGMILLLVVFSTVSKEDLDLIRKSPFRVYLLHIITILFFLMAWPYFMIIELLKGKTR